MSSDSQLRELERKWKESGAIEDAAAYLLERVRVGDLARAKLELAAFIGDQAALAATGGSRVADPFDAILESKSLDESWRTWGRANWVALAVVCADSVLAFVKQHGDGPVLPGLTPMIQNLTEWSLVPSSADEATRHEWLDELATGERNASRSSGLRPVFGMLRCAVRASLEESDWGFWIHGALFDAVFEFFPQAPGALFEHTTRLARERGGLPVNEWRGMLWERFQAAAVGLLLRR